MFQTQCQTFSKQHFITWKELCEAGDTLHILQIRKLRLVEVKKCSWLLVDPVFKLGAFGARDFGPFAYTRLHRGQLMGKKNKQNSILSFLVVVVQSLSWLSATPLQHTSLPCPSLSHWVCSNSCPLNWWYYQTISSSVTLLFFYPQASLASGSLPMSWFFASGGQTTGASASASALPVNIKDWFPLGLTGLISL